VTAAEAVCVNCRPTCPDPTYFQHRIDDPDVCMACGCTDFEPANPE